MAPPIALTPQEREIVLEVLARFVPACEIWVFGARVNGTSGATSALELALKGPSALAPTVLQDMRNEFTQAGLGFAVRLVDWMAADAETRGIVEGHHAVLRGRISA